MDENIILSAKGLDLWYGPTQALKGVSMDIPEKQVTALIGPSGCGKSTFLKTLDRMNDLVPGIKITGSVQYRGQEIYAPNVDVTWLRKQIGMVFQKPNPFPMSIYDNVAYGPRTHGIKSKSRLDDIVEKSLQGAAIWDEVKDRLKKSALVQAERPSAGEQRLYGFTVKQAAELGANVGLHQGVERFGRIGVSVSGCQSSDITLQGIAQRADAAGQRRGLVGQRHLRQ